LNIPDKKKVRQIFDLTFLNMQVQKLTGNLT
jgi:hypothetical protein